MRANKLFTNHIEKIKEESEQRLTQMEKTKHVIKVQKATVTNCHYFNQFQANNPVNKNMSITNETDDTMSKRKKQALAAQQITNKMASAHWFNNQKELDTRTHFRCIINVGPLLRFDAKNVRATDDRQNLFIQEQQMRKQVAFMVQKTIVTESKEHWADLLDVPEYEKFDIFTRRFIDFCQHSGNSIQDYVLGLKKDQVGIESMSKMVQNEIVKRMTMTRMTIAGRMTAKGRAGFEMRDTEKNQFEDILGVRDYEPDTVFYYEDQRDPIYQMHPTQRDGSDYETHRKTTDFDEDLLNDIFDSDHIYNRVESEMHTVSDRLKTNLV